MKRVLLAWEYGGARGHVSMLRLVAESLGPGHSYDAALSRLEHAEELQPLCEHVFRGPRLKVVRPSSRPSVPHTSTFFDTLASSGFLDSSEIHRNIGWWRDLMRHRRIDLLVADSAPRAMLAARSLGIPCVATGSGYFVPPADMPGFPPLLGAGIADGPHLAEMTEAINQAILPYGLSPITRLPELYRSDDQLVCTLPQLDPYGGFREVELVPPLQYQPADASPPGEEVFIYLSSGERNDPAITTAIKRLGLPAVLVCPGLADDRAAEFRAAGLAVTTVALPPAEIRRRSRLMVHSGNHGTLCLGIAMGLPQVALPQHWEQHYQAMRASELGVLRQLEKRQQSSEAIEGLIREALEDRELDRQAKQMAADIRSFVTQDIRSLISRRLSPFLTKAGAGRSPNPPDGATAAAEALPAPAPVPGRAGLQQLFFEMLMESQYWSPQQLQQYQRGELEQLLRHARTNVPFYEGRLDAVFRSDGSIDWDRWHQIPIVTRIDMRDHREAMMARELPVGHGRAGTIESSGSSGLPIAITANSLTAIAANANRWRAHVWHELDWSQTYTARVWPIPGSDWPQGLDAGPWGPPWDLSAQKGRAYKLSNTASNEETLEFLSRTGSRYFSTTPKILHAIALEAERTGTRIDLDAVLAHGEQVSDEDKAAYQRAFGARALEHYSSKEGGQMAYACPAGDGLHINAESVLVEIVDERGLPVAPGEAGRVVITPFVSTAQPLIRYDQGDIASAAAACSCGRGLPVLSAIHGRSMAIFRHPDGRATARLFGATNRHLLGCTFWQIAQVGPLQFEIRYVPDDWSAAADEAAVTRAFREVYFEDAEVAFRRIESVPLSAGGKYIEYINEWSAVP